MHTAHLGSTEKQIEVTEAPGYFVTTLGRVFSYKVQGFQCSSIDLEMPPKQLKAIRAEVGNRNHKKVVWVVSLNAGRAGKKTKPIHRLVLEAFVGPCPEGLVGCHEDDDSANNHLSNLRWDTQRANMKDAARNGKINLGERNGMAILTDAQARTIRKSAKRITQLAEHYGVSRDVIEHVKRGHTFKHVGGL